MIRSIIATTAISALMTASAFADDMAPVSVFTTDDTVISMESTNGYFVAQSGQILASNLLGKTIYTGTSDEAEAIGDVNDVVMSPDGQARAVIVGVGGFLGLGEKEVAIDFARLNWTWVEDERRLSLNATKEELETAPAFERAQIEDATAMNKDAMSADHNDDDMMMVEVDTMSANELIGTRIYGRDNNDIGEIGDVIVSTEGKAEAFIMDIGGFLGLGEKPIALDATEFQIMKDKDGNLSVQTPFTKEQLESYPEYSAEAYNADREAVFNR